MNGTLTERLLDKIVVTETCWLFNGKTHYGKLQRGRAGDGQVLAHRVSYETFVGPIPTGLTLDHLCRTPGCVKPSHLEAVTHRENILRGRNKNLDAHRAGTCTRGHDVKIYGDARRRCRACRRAS